MKIIYANGIKNIVKKFKEVPNLFERLVIFLILGLCLASGVLLLLNSLNLINTPRTAQTAITMSIIVCILVLGIKDMLKQLSYQVRDGANTDDTE